jgi:hypothetical protein
LSSLKDSQQNYFKALQETRGNLPFFVRVNLSKKMG